jgi:P pilus assembly chaperone PapD
LTYTASGVTNGRFELVAAPGVAITSFTQAQINSGAVQFVHNGGEAAPSYSVTVNDGALTSAASAGAVTFTNVNDAPVISSNALTIAEGATVVLGSGNINTTDPDNTPAQLAYTASGVTNGRFELASAPGVAIISFTQTQINSGAVQFVHNGGEVAPSYSLTVNDGALTSAASAGAVTFTNVNDAPVISSNALTIAEGATVVLGSGNINTTDPDNTPAQLTYTASGVTNGRFELVAAPSVAITSFTQAQINSGAVQFVHNGGEVAPSYSVTVNDGALTSAASAGAVTFTNVNDAPVISANALTIAEGATVVLGSGNLNTTDPDNTPAQLTYTASGVTNGRFELVAAPGVAITSFTQAQINSGAVQFAHNGGEVAPSYSVTVNDGALTSAASAGAVTFTNVNDAPVISSNALTIAEGATVVLGSGNHQHHRPRQHARSIDLHGQRRDQRPV